MDRKQPLRVAILTGEPSGDQIGARLIDALKEQNPSLEIFAIAGKKMRQKNPHLIFPQEKLEVMGFSDVIKALPKLFFLFRKLVKKLMEIKPDIVVTIDYPTWHLKLAQTLRKKGFSGKIVQYVSPTVWAYKKKRIQKMEYVIDEVLCIFPFEPKAYKDSNLKASFVGNPLMEQAKQEKGKAKHLTLFPGSRISEIANNLPLQIQTFKLLRKKEKKLTLAISYTSDAIKENIEKVLKENRVKATLFPGLKKVGQSKLAIATSGTVNLELALKSVPTLVCYQTSNFQYFIAKYLLNIQTRFFCIVNILLNKLFFPEFYGPNLDPKQLAQSAMVLLEKKEKSAEFEKLKKILTNKHASNLAAKRILKLSKDR